MPWSVLAAVVGAGGAVAASNNNAKAAKKAAAQGSTTTSEPWAAQQPYLQELFSQALQGYNNGSFGQVAGFSGLENTGRSELTNIAENIRTGMVPQAMAGWQNALNAPNLNNNPYIQAYINASLNPIQDRLQRQVLPGVRADAVSSGMYGGSRQGVGEGLAISDWQRNSGDITSKILSTAYQQGLEQQLQALKLSPVLAELQSYGPNLLRQMGAEQRTMNQAQLDSGYQALARYQGLIGGSQYGSTSHTINPNYTAANPWGSAIGGAASGLSLYNMLNQGNNNTTRADNTNYDYLDFATG